MTVHPGIDDVSAALARIEGLVNTTAIVSAPWIGDGVGLKLESTQRTGSFKVRGAANALLQLSDEERARGVVAVSSGNHGRAVAFVAKHLGIRATICISSRVPPVKVSAMDELGARVIVAGPDQDSADAAARRFVEDDGLVFIHPFDDPRVIAGQGTIGLEILEQRSDVASVLVPLSGGGLAGGIAAAIAPLRPDVRLVGVSQERGPAMIESIRAGHLVDVVEEDTLADALAGGLGEENHHSFALCRGLLDELVTVTESEIGSAMAALSMRADLVVEGGGAVGVAALMAGRVPSAAGTVVVVSGGNVDPGVVDRLVEEYGPTIGA
jgi:threonine dehydratase